MSAARRHYFGGSGDWTAPRVRVDTPPFLDCSSSAAAGLCSGGHTVGRMGQKSKTGRKGPFYLVYWRKR